MKIKSMKKINLISLFILPILLVGCNTMEGAGTDIQQVGKALERSAERNKEDSAPCPYCSRYHQ